MTPVELILVVALYFPDRVALSEMPAKESDNITRIVDKGRCRARAAEQEVALLRGLGDSPLGLIEDVTVRCISKPVGSKADLRHKKRGQK